MFVSGFAKSQPGIGEIMFIGYNADGSDGFAIVTLVDIPENSTIYFTDNEWNGSPIGSGGAFVDANEGELTWSTGGSVIPAGTVVVFDETNNATNPGYAASIGNISGVINLNASNEVLYAFTGTDDVTPTSFLSAISNGGFDSTNGPLTNTNLIEGTNAISIAGDDDVLVYRGDTICNVSVADCASTIADNTNWITDDGTGDQSIDSIGADFPSSLRQSFVGTILPIELISFVGENIGSGKVELHWQTASELNNHYFTIERSIDTRQWEHVTEIAGAGSSYSRLAYRVVDNEPIGGRNYYRLKQTDFDGKFAYSEVISVLLPLPNENQVISKVYPNPAKESVTIYADISELSELKVLNWAGQIMNNQVTWVQKGDYNRVIDISNLAQGVYFLQTKSKSHKLLKL